MKYCPACDTIKDKEVDFTYAGNACRLCALERAKKHRLERRKCPKYVEEFNNKIKERNRQRKIEWIEAAGGSCKDCGGVFPPSVYDFHHPDPSVKEGNPSSLMLNKKGREELKKCILLCSNCHRIRHFEEDRTE